MPLTPQEMVQTLIDTAREVGEKEGLTEEEITELTYAAAGWLGNQPMQ